MTKYTEMQHRHQEEVSDYLSKYGFFAFDQRQLAEGLQELGLAPDDLDKLHEIGAGGFMLRDKVAAFHAMQIRHAEEQEAAASDPEFAFQMFYTELCNHEYCLTRDAGEALDALGLDFDDIRKNPILEDALKRAAVAAVEDSY